MAVPAYIWLYNSAGTLIQGSSNVLLREGAIEMQSFNHGVHIPYDNTFGKLTGTRVHDQLSFTKELDKATPYLNRAVCQGKLSSKRLSNGIGLMTLA